MKKIISALALSVLSASAFAAGQNPLYIGGSFGQAKTDTGLDSTSTISVDEKDSAYKFFVGQQINSIWGIEGYYANLGEVSATNRSTGVRATAEVQSFGVAATAGFNLTNQLRAFGKAGLHYWTGDAVARNGGVTLASDSDNGVDVLFGAGLEFAFDKKLSARVEIESFEGADSRLLSAGISYKF